MQKEQHIDYICRIILMSAYLYYHRNTNVLTDEQNDMNCKYLADNWVSVPIYYKPMLDPDMTDGKSLTASTYQCKYTKRVIAGAEAWAGIGQLKLEDYEQQNLVSHSFVEAEMAIHKMLN
jgi:hypothetical protein